MNFRAPFSKWSTRLGNTPGIIKYPFWQMTNAYPQASYICLNQSEAYAPAEIAGKSICMDTDISMLLGKL